METSLIAATAPIAEGAATARGEALSAVAAGQLNEHCLGWRPACSLRRSCASEGSRPFASGTGRYLILSILDELNS
jgi:hypothetical protein